MSDAKFQAYLKKCMEILESTEWNEEIPLTIEGDREYLDREYLRLCENVVYRRRALNNVEFDKDLMEYIDKPTFIKLQQAYETAEKALYDFSVKIEESSSVPGEMRRPSTSSAFSESSIDSGSSGSEDSERSGSSDSSVFSKGSSQSAEESLKILKNLRQGRKN